MVQQIEPYQIQAQNHFKPQDYFRGTNSEKEYVENDLQSYRQEFSNRTDQVGILSDNNSDNDYELCFVVEEVEFLTYKQGFTMHSQYFRDLLQNVADTQIRILLPLWATANSFRMVLDFVNTGDIQKDIDLNTVQNVLWLADFFQIFQLQKLCIDDFIVPQLTKVNVLTFLEDSFSKLSSCQEQQFKLKQEGQDQVSARLTNFDEQFQQYLYAEDIWYDFFNQCLDVCSINLDFLIKSKEKELLLLPESVIEEVIERALKNQSKTEDNDLVKFMMKMKRISSPFELLEIEKNRVIQTYDKLVHTKMSPFADPQYTTTNQVKPLLTWRLSNLNLKQNFYKESDPFFVEGIQWILFISKMNDKECQIGVKYSSPLDEDNVLQKYSQKKKDGYSLFDRYSILSLLNWVRIDSEPSLNHQSQELIKVSHMVLTNQKSQAILRTIPLQLINQRLLSSGINVEVYFSIRHTVASILSYISTNFQMLARDSQIHRLKPQEISLLLTHRKLNVKSEDEVIEALMQYLHRNLSTIEDKDLIDILKQVNWPYVSFEKLLEIFKAFPIMRSNIHIKSIFYNEFRYRACKKSNQMCQPPRISYDSVMIETIFDFQYFLDKVADYLFKIFDQQTLMNSPLVQAHLSFQPTIQKSQVLNNSNLINLASDLDSQKHANYKTMNKTFLEEQYYQKVNELNAIQKELQRRQPLNNRYKRDGDKHSSGQNSSMKHGVSIQNSNLMSPSSSQQQKNIHSNAIHRNKTATKAANRSNSRYNTHQNLISPQQQNQQNIQKSYQSVPKNQGTPIKSSSKKQSPSKKDQQKISINIQSQAKLINQRSYQKPQVNQNFLNSGELCNNSSQELSKLDNRVANQMSGNRQNLRGQYLEDYPVAHHVNQLAYSDNLQYDVGFKNSHQKKVSTKGSQRYMDAEEEEEDYNNEQQLSDDNQIPLQYNNDLSSDQIDQHLMNQNLEQTNQEESSYQAGDHYQNEEDEGDDEDDYEGSEVEPGITINRYTSDEGRHRNLNDINTINDSEKQNIVEDTQASHLQDRVKHHRKLSSKKFLDDLNNSQVQ